jgi:predicted nucleic acid-binding protein
VHPTEKHWQIFRETLVSGKATANLVMDAHLAALALEHGCQLNSTDTDFARFPKLAWRNPLGDSDKHR